MSDDVMIRFRHVTKNYRLSGDPAAGLKNVLLHLPRYIRAARARKPFCALSDVSLEVTRGESLGIIGRNGSGKSTTLGLMAGVLRPSSGEIETHGRIAPLLELGAGLHFELTGVENIMLNGVLLGLTREAVRERMDDIIAFSELGDFIHHPVRVYSSGMVARLGFSVAVHLEPDVLLVDEVLAVGDQPFQQKCFRKMSEFLTNGTTVVFVSHSMDTVRRVCTRVAFLDAGRLVDVGSPEAIISEYAGHLER
ncbi:MAG TPA: ABC transporter ATP-binding protein [Planctomycetota bacterium]|nr:ABC transporter ATP-binding protein [Planctomycetota bacterium]HUV38863.1 ABC transporter ATP-binding protein [Planctomycetota bacterium]